MEKLCDFLLGASDLEVSSRLLELGDQALALDRRLTQEEDFFLVLPRPFVVDSFEIHHDIRNVEPSPQYLRVIRSLVESWAAQVPGVFHGLTWFFDPRDLFHPLFLQFLSVGGRQLLYVLRPDLTYRNRYGEILTRGGNDVTPRYSTSALFLESEVLVLDGAETFTAGQCLVVPKLFQKTWKGESGRGYFVTGSWIDHDITQLLSRVALPVGAKAFPCYPLRCRYESLSVRCLSPTPEGRLKAAQILVKAWPLVRPWAHRIESALKDEPYREDHPLVEQLRDQWGEQLSSLWEPYELTATLNSANQKEYAYHAR